MDTTAKTNFHWSCKHTWKRSAKNTGWCLLGCAIGDLGTILFFQLTKIPFPLLGIMILAIVNGLITSIILETIILMRQNFNFSKAFKIAIGGESSVSLGYNFPNAFKIKFNFKDAENRNIPKILPCYLRNVSHTINPTGGGFKNDGKPNEVDLTLGFVEHRAIEQQDIEKGF